MAFRPLETTLGPNDVEDDERAIRVARRGRASHLVLQLLDVVRRHSYLANTPFAIRWRRVIPRNPSMTVSKLPALEDADPERLLVPVDTRTLPPAEGENASFSQLLKYARFLEQRGSRLTVFVLSRQSVSLDFHRRCLDHGIEAYLVDAPPGMQLAQDGHFNYFGNLAFGRLVGEKITGRDFTPQRGSAYD